MTGIRLGWLATLVLVCGACLLGGCKTQQLEDDNARYKTQNTELQDELNRTRAALEAAENDRNTSAAELERLRAALADAEARAAAGNQGPPEGGLIVHETHTKGDKRPFSDLPSNVEVDRTVKGRITVRLPGDVLFSPGKIDLTPSAKSTLAKVAKTLNTAEKGHPIRVEGYTDTDPIKHSHWKSNQQLSEARAEAVAKYLEHEGVAVHRITTEGFGPAKPRETKAKSRRVEIVVLTGK